MLVFWGREQASTTPTNTAGHNANEQHRAPNRGKEAVCVRVKAYSVVNFVTAVDRVFQRLLLGIGLLQGVLRALDRLRRGANRQHQAR